MNAKKKLADAKAKLRKNAPQIALITTTVTGIAYAVYTIAKNAKPVTIISAGETPIEGTDEVVVVVTLDELNRLAENDSYEVTNIDRDLFHLKETNA